MSAPYTENSVVSLPESDVSNARNLGETKETFKTLSLVCILQGEAQEAVTVRLYCGRSRNASKVYASLWIRSADRKRWLGGHGSAGGYGYCKSSAAVDSALSSAGVKMEKRFDGAGMSTAKVALEAVAVAMGWNLAGSIWIEHG